MGRREKNTKIFRGRKCYDPFVPAFPRGHAGEQIVPTVHGMVSLEIALCFRAAKDANSAVLSGRA